MVVLKILDRGVSRDPLNVQRFADEGVLFYGIDSPYVVKVFDQGMTNSYGNIAMEFFGRGDLAQRIKQPVSAADAVLFLHNIACGLDAIHRAGVVHRDLKPGNIMFRSDTRRSSIRMRKVAPCKGLSRSTLRVRSSAASWVRSTASTGPTGSAEITRATLSITTPLTNV